MNNTGLLFFLDEEFTTEDTLAIRELISEIAAARSWHAGAPRFVAETDTDSGTRPEDEPVRTVGGFLELPLPAKPPDMAVEGPLLNDVDYLIQTLARFTLDRPCEIGIELSGEYIDGIKNGVVGRSIAIGLLYEWRKSL